MLIAEVYASLRVSEGISTDSSDLSHRPKWLPMIHHKLAVPLDSFQSIDQVGFRPVVGVEFEVAVFEDVDGKMCEWDTDLGERNLKRLFDRVEYESLFSALSR